MTNEFRASKLSIDGVYTEDFGVYLKERPDIPTAVRDVEFVEVRGRDAGALTKKYGHRDVEMFANFHMYDEVDGFRRVYRLAKPRILDAERLVFDDDPSVYYKVKAVRIDESPTVLYKYGEIPTYFTLEPYAYDVEETIVTATGQRTINIDSYDSLPIINVSATGSGRVFVGDYELMINNVNGTLIIDSEQKNAYRPGNPPLPANNRVEGDFPVLKSGDNIIDFSGDIARLDITFTKRWR